MHLNRGTGSGEAKRREGGGNANSGIINSGTRRDGREAEGGGLLNRYRVKSSIGGSNPPLSAISFRINNLQYGDTGHDT